MTELERPLTAALERLSAQYETEQQRQSEQVAALQQRVEQQATSRGWSASSASQSRNDDRKPCAIPR